jgi:hypothetical protein
MSALHPEDLQANRNFYHPILFYEKNYALVDRIHGYYKMPWSKHDQFFDQRF